MSEKIEKLREMIFQNPALLGEMRRIAEKDKFVSRLVEIGCEHDLIVAREEILEEMNKNTRAWIERWI